jgi:hypothetical protein
MFGHIFTVKTLIRAALTAISIANMGVARAEFVAPSGDPVAVNAATATNLAGLVR